jgi:hypothetical protein
MTCDMGETLSNALRMHRRALRKMQKEKKRLHDENDEMERRRQSNVKALIWLYEAMRHTRAHIITLESDKAAATYSEAESCKTTNSVPGS